MGFYEMDDISKKTTPEMIQLLRAYIRENNISDINDIQTVEDPETQLVKGIVSISNKNCNDEIKIGESGTLQIIGYRIMGTGRAYSPNTIYYPEITIYNSENEQIKQYKPANKNEMFKALKEILKSNPVTADTTTGILKIIVRLLENIDSNTKPKE